MATGQRLGWVLAMCLAVGACPGTKHDAVIDAGAAAQRADGGAELSSNVAHCPPEGCEPRGTAGMQSMRKPDASVAVGDDGEDAGPASELPGAQHAQCKTPFPEAIPPLPISTRWDISGRPGFDLWRDVSCDAAKSVPTCTMTDNMSCGTCLKGAGSDTGVCSQADIDVWCDGEGDVMGLTPGCYICTSYEAHARACCEGLDVDCRAWPFPADGKRGMVCARHEDCEAGLVCGEPSVGSGYGICHCPEEAAAPRDLRCDERINN